MRLVLITALLLPLPLLSAPASAQKSKPDKMVCKSEARLASRVPTRICKTAAEWSAIEEQAKRNMGEVVNQPRMNPVGCGGSRPC